MDKKIIGVENSATVLQLCLWMVSVRNSRHGKQGVSEYGWLVSSQKLWSWPEAREKGNGF